jgi:hypothetical protein
MKLAPIKAHEANVADNDDIDQRRIVSWLHSWYREPFWTVSDTRDPTRTATIDFRFVLADGRLLIDVPSLYATVKEYAWWVRDSRFSSIDDASTHASMVRNLMYIAHALSRRAIWSFAHLQPYDIEQLVEECRYGTDAVLHASERVEAYLAKLAAEHAAAEPELRKRFGGLPEYVIPSTGGRSKTVHAEPILAACNLPQSAGQLPRVATLIGLAAIANGLNPRWTQQARSLEPLKNQTAQTIQRWLDPLEQLHAMRRRMEADALSFKPFTRGAARVAAVKGVGTVRTPTPPPTLALHLLEHATRWVFERGDSDLSQIADRDAARLLGTACWVLIAAFSARRDGEIDELGTDCLRGDDQTGWWLHVYIEKTLQRKEWIPVPGLVARAIHLLRALSAEARASTGSNQLFQWQSPTGEVVLLDCGRHLDQFANAVKVPMHRPRGGQPVVWHWHPHQFRRFYAILYFYRFEGATIEALSHHLRHFSLEMTKRYVTEDPEVAALWLDVEWGYMGHVARTIVAGERSVSGAAGSRLKRLAHHLLDTFRRKLQVVSPERVGASLTILMERRGLVLTPKPWVTCSCPATRDAAAAAACRRQAEPKKDAVGPDFAQAGPTVCCDCPHAIMQAHNRGVVDSEIVRLEAISNSKPRAGTLFGLLEEARVVELHSVRATKYADATAVRQPATESETGA